MTQAEKTVRNHWIGWGRYAKWTHCAVCRMWSYCRARDQGRPFYCLDCYDQRKRK